MGTGRYPCKLEEEGNRSYSRPICTQKKNVFPWSRASISTCSQTQSVVWVSLLLLLFLPNVQSVGWRGWKGENTHIGVSAMVEFLAAVLLHAEVAG